MSKYEFSVFPGIEKVKSCGTCTEFFVNIDCPKHGKKNE